MNRSLSLKPMTFGVSLDDPSFSSTSTIVSYARAITDLWLPKSTPIAFKPYYISIINILFRTISSLKL